MLVAQVPVPLVGSSHGAAEGRHSLSCFVATMPDPQRGSGPACHFSPSDHCLNP